MSKNQLQNVSQFDKQYIISDEIYHGLVYKDRAHSILEFTDKAFVINGFSKLYAMTGWRLGYCIFPKEFSQVMQRIHQNFMISANGFIQWAGIAALTKAQKDVTKMVKIYDWSVCFFLLSWWLRGVDRPRYSLEADRMARLRDDHTLRSMPHDPHSAQVLARLR